LRSESSSVNGCQLLLVGLGMLAMLLLLSCSPRVGSDAWCKKLKETPKADWSTNEATAFAKHCIFK